MHPAAWPQLQILQERRMELLELWQVALSAESVTALDMRKYMITSLVSDDGLYVGTACGLLLLLLLPQR